MQRLQLIALQVLVAVVALTIWHVFTTYPVFGVMLLPPFFFSTPVDVFNRIVKWLIEGSIWRHLMITLTEASLAFVIGSLSGGQRKRVGLAQVLIRDPKILLMDEPFGPLDAQTRQIMGNLLLELWNAERKAVLFVTHDLEEAIALADRVVIMGAGPASNIIGQWKVDLPRPRDIMEVRLQPAFHTLHREIWSALRDEVVKGYEQAERVA